MIVAQRRPPLSDTVQLNLEMAVERARPNANRQFIQFAGEEFFNWTHQY